MNWLVLDLEATCCNNDEFPTTEMEIIEIGACMIENARGTVVSEFQTFIQPVRNPALTKFCTDLTSIQQAQVDVAPRYPEALRHFQAWMSGFLISYWGSWGNYDRYQFAQDCAFHSVPFLIEAMHVNLKAEFTRRHNLKKRPSLSKALELAGLPFSGTQHRGIDDARNIACIMLLIVGDAVLPFSGRGGSLA